MRLSALFLLVVVLVTGLTSYEALEPQRSETLSFWLLAILPVTGLGAIAAAWAAHDGLLAEWVTPTWGDATRGVMGGLALLACAWGFARIATPVGSPREIWLVAFYGEVGNPRRLVAHANALAGGVIVGAIADEILWRGLVTQLLADRVGSRTAWIWAAVLYGFAYLPTAWALRVGQGLDPLLVFAALGGGLVLGAMTRVFGRIVPSIVAHALFVWGVLMMVPLWGP
ncbi:MAG: CPBP family intramembrane glutamic endopeptidase [Polyangiaceae bacterium]|jgi:membrane protease YdiL (CAAX protease family)